MHTSYSIVYYAAYAHILHRLTLYISNDYFFHILYAIFVSQYCQSSEGTMSDMCFRNIIFVLKKLISVINIVLCMYAVHNNNMDEHKLEIIPN